MTVYKRTADLRGKFVLLRTGRICFLSTARREQSYERTRYYGNVWQHHRSYSGIVWQRHWSSAPKEDNDIMKVLPLSDARIDLRGRTVRLGSGEEVAIPADAERLPWHGFVAYGWNDRAVFQGGATRRYTIVKVVK